MDSTNAVAARLAPELTQPTWIIARRQTAGRGRRGRAWIAPEGNFCATLVMRPPDPPDAVAQRSFVSALALAEALEELIGDNAAITLKWPNDVLVNGGKAAGILLESVGQAGGVSHLAIGIGVNLIAAPPPEAVEPGAMPAVSILEETGLRILPEQLLTRLAAAFARWEYQLVTFGFGPVRNAWLARAARIGETITARTVREVIEGRFEGIDAGGALVLVTASGRRTVPAADVYF